jgi:hypothetical protein
MLQKYPRIILKQNAKWNIWTHKKWSKMGMENTTVGQYLLEIFWNKHA